MSPAATLLVSFFLISATTQLGSTLETTAQTSNLTHGNETIVLQGNEKILSENRTFEMGFFNPRGDGDGEPNWYLGIWYASIPTPTYIWVANRGSPVKNLSSAAAVITTDGELAVEVKGGEVLWKTENTAAAVEARLLEEGNLVLMGGDGEVVWRSFDFPTDTWLPGMNLTGEKFLTSWRRFDDPAVGKYSLRLKPPAYGEVELVFNGTEEYWGSGEWTGSAFSGVPEMTIPYIYRFHFSNPFKPTAAFWYTETSLESGVQPPLTRFHVDISGQLRQYTWSPQAENWNMFWSQPENLCKVYGHCGNFGFCSTRLLNPCTCIANFQPVDANAWGSGDFSGGCRRQDATMCGGDDGFEEVGLVSFEGAVSESFSVSRSKCDSTCLSNCSCIGLIHNSRTNLCKTLFGSLLNLRNSTSDFTNEDILYIRVSKASVTKKKKKKTMILIVTFGGIVVISAAMVVLALLVLRRRRTKTAKGGKEGEDAVFPNLSWDVRLRIAVGTARAIAYLHEGCRDCIIHCDIKPENILLGEDFSPKVSDFGLAKLVGRDISRVLATMRGTWGYVAPEWISGVAITAKADVYSYGMTLLELLGGRRNVEKPPSAGGGGGGGEGEKWFFPPWAAKRIIEGNVAAVVDERLIASGYDVVAAERVGFVAVWCIQDEEGMRPAMETVVKMLEGVVAVSVPPPPKLLQAFVSGESFHGVGGDSGTGNQTEEIP
ncbi:hypothetical protein Vadar_021296 [Vaccinium darrowii]|uniref:Uncharacterized protein n=1 Tax=Vaccinium darrowii TaxID=229202 RepID=A0ACB7Y8C7_9ERIC|nr:hypothetical protein Vadar_021296 [Vaccinium darrowii]